jgi:translation initiation factor IF-2
MGKNNKNGNNNFNRRTSNINNRQNNKPIVDKEHHVVIFRENKSISELAKELSVSPTEIIKFLFLEGKMVNINSSLDASLSELVCMNFGYDMKIEKVVSEEKFEELEIVDDEKDLVERPPIVTIMGHVDHGKTTLLDAIRKSRVVEGEVGGITQSIGAYQVEVKGKKITFLDTPGHEAFAAMRARGAQVTDIVILVVAADDGVMPQTREAIDHAKAANVPIVVAVNKIDKPDANKERIRQEMSEAGITPEEWGGDYPFVDISAKTGEGVELLLETIQTISEVNDFKANPNRYAVGSVIESRLDKNIGGVASLLIQNGTLRLGDPIVVGTCSGKVRTMKNDLGASIVSAGPSTPVEITGLSDNPSAGDKFMAFETESEAKSIASKRAVAARDQRMKQTSLSLDDLFNKISAGQKEINVVLKADVRGSEEAVKNALEKIDVESVKVKVIRSGIGTITESDVVLANASNAIIIGFNVSPSNKTREVAKEYNVDIRLYTIIYKVVEEMELAMKGMLDPEYVESELGEATIRKIFKFSKVGNIAGSYVNTGIIKNNSLARVIRDGIVIYEGKIASVQREKDVVKEVKKGFECGITLENFIDIKEGDIIKSYEMVEVKR